MKVDEQKLANKCGRLAQSGAASASPRTRSSLFTLRPRRHNHLNNDSRLERIHEVEPIAHRNKDHVVQLTGGRSAVLLSNGSIIFERRPRETGIRELGVVHGLCHGTNHRGARRRESEAMQSFHLVAKQRELFERWCRINQGLLAQLEGRGLDK